MVRSAAALLIVLALARVSPAQIYEWRDAEGARHFTTDAEDLPLDQRQNPRVVVRQSAWGSVAAREATAEVEAERRSEAQVVYDRSYRRRRAADEREAGGGGAVYIQGPLAVASVEWAQPPAGPAYSIPVAAVPLEFPLVTTSFDRGRSRHLTLRMLLQDQFQIDRDGPFLYERLGGLGPQFRPFLPRGLTRGYPRVGRVVTR